MIADPSNRFALRAWLGFHPIKDQVPSHRNCAPYRTLVADQPLDVELLRRLTSDEVSVSGTGSTLLKRQAEVVLARLDDSEGKNAELLVNDILGDEALALSDEETAVDAGRDLAELRAGTFEILAASDGDLKETLEDVRIGSQTGFPSSIPRTNPSSRS